MENFDYFAFIGTYTKGNVVNQGLESKGIYILGYNSKNGELNLLNTALEKDNPSFLSISPEDNSFSSSRCLSIKFFTFS